MSSTQRAPARGVGGVSAKWRSDGALEATLWGYQDAGTLTELITHCKARLAERRPRCVLFDVTAMSGFAPDVRQPGFQLLSVVRAAGVARGVVAVSSGAVRMMGLAIAFAAGLPLEMVETRAQAERRLAEILAEQR